MESIFEQQRRLHEEKERLIDSMVREALSKRSTHKAQINSDHRMKMLMDRYLESTATLKDLYDDRDGARKSEAAALSGPNELNEFYSRLKQLKDFHKRHPDEISIPMSLEFENLNKQIEDPNRVEENLVEFTDEEGYGRFLDLHQFYDRFVNLKGIEKIDYINYLATFDRLYEIAKERKTPEYRRYLESLLEYLRDFLHRVKPLLEINDEIEKTMAEFLRKWNDFSFPGWQKDFSSAISHSGAYLDLSPFTNPEDLMQLGLDRLKSALIALGLKCGGTLEQRAHRLFQTKGKRLEDLDPSLFAQRPSVIGKTNDEQTQKKQKEIAMLEAQVYHLVELLSEQRQATKDNIVRKQARGYAEDDEEEEEIQIQQTTETENDDDIPYNPKNLPLDWDGKPIPYWLYKLHGLNISYPCEICGNVVYKGPKAFQRHFSEWRHAHGMRCLGIPNTAHFANVTKIQDAIELWTQLRENKEQERFKPEVEEEFEDSYGNVVNRKTFEDLKRQGLL